MSSTEATYRLGISPDPLSPAGYSETLSIITALVEQAQQQLLVSADTLDPRLFDSPALIRAMQAHIARRPRAPVRWLVEDSASLPRRVPQVLELCRRFGSYMKLHRPADEDAHESTMFIVADMTGYLHQPYTGQPLFKASFHDTAEANRLAQQFEERWQRSTPVTEVSVAGL